MIAQCAITLLIARQHDATQNETKQHAAKQGNTATIASNCNGPKYGITRCYHNVDSTASQIKAKQSKPKQSKANQSKAKQTNQNNTTQHNT